MLRTANTKKNFKRYDLKIDYMLESSNAQEYKN